MSGSVAKTTIDRGRWLLYASLLRRFTTRPIKRPNTTTNETVRGSGTALVAVITNVPEDVVVKLAELASSTGD